MKESSWSASFSSPKSFLNTSTSHSPTSRGVPIPTSLSLCLPSSELSTESLSWLNEKNCTFWERADCSLSWITWRKVHHEDRMIVLLHWSVGVLQFYEQVRGEAGTDFMHLHGTLYLCVCPEATIGTIRFWYFRSSVWGGFVLKTGNVQWSQSVEVSYVDNLLRAVPWLGASCAPLEGTAPPPSGVCPVSCVQHRACLQMWDTPARALSLSVVSPATSWPTVCVLS